jgi:hypothetical protein
MSGKIYAPLKTAGLVNDPNDPTNTYGDITGSDVGNKRALDVMTDSRPLDFAIDEVSASVTYVGFAAMGTATSAASWQIKKLLTTGTVTVGRWADSNANFDNVWDDRASLVYS